MPPGVWPDPAGDGHMILVDPKARRSWEFSRVHMGNAGPESASRIFVWDLDGPGFRPPFAGKAWWTTGTTASGLPLVAGLIKPAEFEAGRIEHALICAGPTIRKSLTPGGGLQLCAPAARTDGHGIGPEYIPMGARLRLDPSLDLDALGLSKPAQVVARAMQRYGLFMGISGATFKIFFQNIDPEGKYWSKYRLKDEMAKIPVSSFQVLPCETITRPPK